MQDKYPYHTDISQFFFSPSGFTDFYRIGTLALNRFTLTTTTQIEQDFKVFPRCDLKQVLLIPSEFLYAVLISQNIKQKQFVLQPVFDSVM